MPEVDDIFEPQDEAEVFDETHSVDEGPTGAQASPEADPQELPDVFDVTSARGDADEDGDEGQTADDYDDDLADLDLDEDGDEDKDDDLDDDLEDEPEYDARSGLDRLIDRVAERSAPIEPGLYYVDDLDAITNPRDDDVEKYETTRQLSDEQLADLGYLQPPAQKEMHALKDKDDGAPAPAGRTSEHRSFVTGAGTGVRGSGASADDVRDEADPHEQELLDEALEETFPASDPVSAKHIT